LFSGFYARSSAEKKFSSPLRFQTEELLEQRQKYSLVIPLGEKTQFKPNQKMIEQKETMKMLS